MQHVRYDRDEHLWVYWDNIKEKNKYNFYKKDKIGERFGTKYDYLSCMHYRNTSWSKNGKRTLVAKDKAYVDIIGKVTQMSKADAIRINAMYKCPK